MEAQLAGLASCCERMSSALETSQASTAGLVASTEALRAELACNARRGQLVCDFLDKYQLAPGEVSALREGEVGSEAFYAALGRVAEIHDNCRNLLRRHHRRAGLELMDAMALYQEGAYERLCRWVQAQCRALEADVPEVQPPLARGVAALRARPLLHRHAAEEAANARQQALFGRFIAALTRGGPAGVPRPMEVHAHDPRRYVGDMCAWLHQACAGEREFVHALLGGAEEGDSAAAAPAAGGDAAQLVDAGWALDRVFEGVCRPFKMRVEASLAGVPPSALLQSFQLAQLLAFYAQTLASLVGAASVLTCALGECRDAATRALFAQLAGRRERLLRFPPAPEPNVQPPPPFAEAAQRVTELLSAAEAAMGGGGEGANDSLTALLDPLLDAAQRGAATLAHAPDMPPWAGSAYLINCLALLRAPLQGQASESAQQRERHLAAQAEAAMVQLVAGETQRVLGGCGLAPFVELSAAGASGPALSPTAAGPALEAFYARLASAAPLSGFLQLQGARERTDAARRVAAALADAYECVHTAVRAAHPGAQLRYSVAQARIVCDGL